ncbi:Dinucleoside triphosphate hydrolase [Pleurotus ostreatus]|uniref:Bis(5'-adenosyl)-triphosphatase n=1 Tax=Pleurotus ostreatus (strain PC15) TaxID=1137138 RepID=A0A067NW03_PLEO1|nr:Dinucleoside triphosphate hydrolase [Pleurotus ostreatus]KDQ31190.1 HIT domain protein [Pleurotus ostreatus PC15]
MASRLLFSTVDVTKQVFYRSSLSFAIVNLKPIVPGHVLVIPTRVVTRMTDLTEAELSSLMHSVQAVGRVVERAYGADGLTVACQDGKAAGQTMPHVHFHILPRKLQGDRFSKNNDEVYPAIEQSEAELSTRYERNAPVPAMEGTKMDADEDRVARTLGEMEEEARWLQGFFGQQQTT